MNLYDSSFLCLDIGSFSVTAMAHRVRSGRITKSAIHTVQNSDTVFAIKSAVDEMERQLGAHFDSAFITGNFGESDFKTIAKSTQWQHEHKITETDIQNQISGISGEQDLYSMHIFPLRYDTNSSSNLVTPVGKTDNKLISIFGAIFYKKEKMAEVFEILRQAHIQAEAIFDSSYLMNLALRDRKQNAMFIDLGSQFTTVSIWTGRGPVFFKKFNENQSDITIDISEKLNLSVSDAMRIKHSVSSVKADEMDRFTPADSLYDFSRADLNDIILPKLGDIVSRINETASSAIEKYKPGKIFLYGGGSDIIGVDEFFECSFGLPVQNMGVDAPVRAMATYIWGSQSSRIKKYIARKNKWDAFTAKIISKFNRNKKVKRFIPIMPSTLAFDMKINDTYTMFKSAGISMIHVDIMDGFFVDKISGGIDELKSIREKTDAHLHVHLMTESPVVWATAAANAGADTIIVSTNTAGVRAAILKIKELGKRSGIALNPETPVDILKPVLKEIDEILIMSVRPGNGGQEFEENILQKISVLANTRKKYGLKYKISVDGGINPESAQLCWQAGADFLVSGTYIAKAPDFSIAIQSLLRTDNQN